MQTRRIILFLGILLTICKILQAQVSSNSYSMEVTGKPIYNSITGEMINEEKLHLLFTSNPRLRLDPVINKYGEVESFLYVPETKDFRSARDTSKRTKAGELFPQFVMKSVNGKKLDSEKLNGKPILLHFQLFFKPPFFNEKQFHQFESMVDSLKQENGLEAIVVTESDKKEIRGAINAENCKFEIVPDGRNFAIRYLVVTFPSFILIDREGKLIRYYEGNELTSLQQDIKFQCLQK